jgi:lambda repressor-like predicted transcriptional regulator
MPPERLAEMKSEGWTLKEMATEFGCHPSTVSLRLLRHGLR